jgi:hypothetical protein
VNEDRVHFGPVFGVSWASGLVDGYAEAGGILWHECGDADFELDTDDEMTHRVTIGASLRF